MDWQRLSISIDGLECDRLLSDWRWLVPDDLQLVSMTVFGDCFLKDFRGSIHFLDTLAGKLTLIAPSTETFLTEREKSENLDEWYMIDLALLCWESGLRPAIGQCLSFKMPPVLSGPVELDNVEVCDLLVHESIMGQLHRGVRDLPEGAVINRFTVDGEVP